VLERLETEARNNSDHGEDHALFRESRRNQPCRMNHFSISTATNTIDERARHSSSSSRSSGSVLKIGLNAGMWRRRNGLMRAHAGHSPA
jgi:hypothetical protein